MNFLKAEDLDGRRWYRDQEGHYYISNTESVEFLNTAFFQEDPWLGVPAPLQKMHMQEGEGAHQAALEWLAYTHQLLPSFEIPAWPKYHPDEQRWNHVMANALAGMQEWVKIRHVVPLAIERASLNRRLGLAGQPDLKCEVSYRGRRVRAIAELKFTAELITAHRIQLRNYRYLEGFEDCRLGFLVHINRGSGMMKEKTILWTQELHHDAAVLNAIQLLQWGRLYGK